MFHQLKKTILSFLKNIKILLEEVPPIKKEMLGKINCTNEYKRLQNKETNSLYETLFLTKITFKMQNMPTCDKSKKINLMQNLDLITKIPKPRDSTARRLYKPPTTPSPKHSSLKLRYGTAL